MSDNYENFLNARMIQDRVCSVAYTLNDTQPVICTYIGDQPLFYFEEEIIEDEELFDPSELGMLAHEIQILKEEINALETPSFNISEQTMKNFESFAENAESFDIDFCLAPGEQLVRLESIIKTLEQSRLAAAYLNVAEKHNIKIKMSDQVEQAFYDRRSGTILLYPHMDEEDQILLVARELRRHWQHRQGALINPMMFQPENALLINRAQEADLTVSVIRIAWELQLAGTRNVWERVENSPLSDLARAFAREAFMDFRTINDGSAAAAVFEAWFLSERCRGQDKKIIQAMLADYNGYVFNNEAASENVTAELIAALGSMPFGKNYLSAHAAIIMEDPIFTEVRDRSNANFLWFIKFEKSFKESEQHLQSESDLSTQSVDQGGLNTKSQDFNYERTQSADIIQLFEYQSETDNKTRKSFFFSRRAKQGESAEIIDLQIWSKQQ